MMAAAGHVGSCPMYQRRCSVSDHVTWSLSLTSMAVFFWSRSTTKSTSCRGPRRVRTNQIERLSRSASASMLMQANAASSHLLNHNVGPGDLFLFFGRFRHAERVDRHLSFAQGRDMHALFGYLYVGEILQGCRTTHFPDWALRHPHTQECFLDSPAYKYNQIFIAAPVV